MGVIEAKREEEGHKLTVHEEQSEGYANGKLKWVNNKEPLPFVYESTGIITRFTDLRDPKPRSRPVFSFHRPETLPNGSSRTKPCARGLHKFPNCPTRAARLPDQRHHQPGTVVQRKPTPRLDPDGHRRGKTFTAITSIYRLLKYADAKRILFLVDTKNLGEQAEQEFMAYTPNDDNRKFTELYNVQRLQLPLYRRRTARSASAPSSAFIPSSRAKSWMRPRKRSTPHEHG